MVWWLSISLGLLQGNHLGRAEKKTTKLDLFISHVVL